MKSLDKRLTLYQLLVPGVPEIAEILIQNGANRNAANGNGNTPLHIAAAEREVFPGHLRLIDMLLRNGADVNAVNIDGVTPLSVAITTGKVFDSCVSKIE